MHTHMTNSLNTPAEALEYSYPLRVREYSLRPGGKRRRPGDRSIDERGGDGIVREIEVLDSMHGRVPLLSGRRTVTPGGGGWGSFEIMTH